MLDKLKLPNIVVPDLTDFKVRRDCYPEVACAACCHVNFDAAALDDDHWSCCSTQLKPYVAYSPPPKK